MWKPFPLIKPEENEKPIWYDVLLDDNSTIGYACWWLGVWYCYNEWDRVIGWRVHNE